MGVKRKLLLLGGLAVLVPSFVRGASVTWTTVFHNNDTVAQAFTVKFYTPGTCSSTGSGGIASYGSGSIASGGTASTSFTQDAATEWIMTTTCYPTYQCMGTVPSGGSVDLYVSASCTLSNDVPAPFYCDSNYYTNTATVPIYVSAYLVASCLNGGHMLAESNIFMVYPSLAGTGEPAVWLPPGGVAGFTECVSCPWTSYFFEEIASLPGNPTNTLPIPTNILGGPVITNGAPTPPGTTNTSGGGGINPPGGTGGTGTGGGPPMGGGPAGQGSSSNLTGGQFYAAMTNLGNIIWQGDQEIVATLTNVAGLIDGTIASSGLGGLTGGSGTNLAGIGGTNGFGEGLGTNAMDNYGNFRTNVGWSDGLGLLPGLNGGTMSNTLAGLSNSVASGTPAEDFSLFTTSALIPGYTINLDPGSVMPGVPALFRQVFDWLATLGFLWWCIKAWRDAVWMSISSHVGSVPDFEVTAAGFGGNLLGFLCWVVVPAVFGLIWVGLLILVLSVLSPAVSTLSVSPFVGWTSTVARNALHLFNEFCDWPYLVGLMTGRILYGFVFPWLAAVSGMASRL